MSRSYWFNFQVKQIRGILVEEEEIEIERDDEPFGSPVKSETKEFKKLIGKTKSKSERDTPVQSTIETIYLDDSGSEEPKSDNARKVSRIIGWNSNGRDDWWMVVFP